MKKLFLLAAFAMPLALLSCQENNASPDSPKKTSATAVCVTGDVDEVTINSATLNGVAVITGTPSEPASAAFYVSANGPDAASVIADGNKVSAGVITGEEGGPFTAVVSDLNPATLYYYVAEVAVDGKTARGQVAKFTTLSRPAEVIVTAEATNITRNSAVLYGYADLEQTGVNGVQFGIIVSTNENPSEANGRLWRCYEVDRNNKYFAEVSDLNANTVYYYKAYIKVGDLLKVGEVKSFTTTSYDLSVQTKDASDITPFNAYLNGAVQGEDKNLVQSVGFLYSATDSSQDALKKNGVDVVSNLNSDGSFVGFTRSQDPLHVALTSSTKYYYIAYAEIFESGHGYQLIYGEVKSFTTPEITASVSTGDATDIGFDTATVSGAVRTDETMIGGFLYSSTSSTIEELKNNNNSVFDENFYSGSYTYSATFTGLSAGTKYYYVAINLARDGKEFFGEVKSFTTKSINATVETLDADDIELFTATLNGSIQIQNTENLSKSVWFLYSSSASTLDALKSSGTKVSTESISYDGIFVYVLEGLPSATKFYYVACANVAGKLFYGQVKSFSTHKESDYGEAVDLGLSVKWRSCNIGATTPEGYGNYFAWGETEPKTSYTWSTYKWCNGSSSSLTKYNTSNSYGVRDNRTVLEKDDDVAFVKLGGKWRMPTDEELAELSYCTLSQITQNGVNGFLITGPNGNSIFLPTSGYMNTSLRNRGSYCYYWSSSLRTEYPYQSWYYNGYNYNYNERYLGYSVRPVTE